jgi:hypothetical protein
LCRCTARSASDWRAGSQHRRCSSWPAAAPSAHRS